MAAATSRNRASGYLRFRAAKKALPAIEVDGLAALLGELRAAEVAITDDEPPEGYDWAYVDDPFGNRLELLEPHRA